MEAKMSDFSEGDIRELAYRLWERDGSPHGKDHEYWHAAERLLAEDGTKDDVEVLEDGKPVVPIIIPLVQ
jgi:hypothetical protein